MIDFIQGYKKQLVSLINTIDENVILEIITLINITSQNGGKIYVLVNGGSAATASLMVNDWGVGLSRRDIMYLDIESLSDNSSVCTALANDIGYENIFYMQLKNKLKKLSDINFHIQTGTGSYGLVEDLHMIFDHIIYSYYIEKGK